MTMINRVKNILINPKSEWTVIKSEEADSGKILVQYIIPLATAAAIASFVGFGLVGFNVMGMKFSGIEWGIYHAVNAWIVSIGTVYLTAYIIDALAPNFNSEKNFGRSFQLVAYSYTAGWIGGLLSFLPFLGFIGSLFSLYGLYLLFTGMTVLKKTPEENHIGYLITTIVVLIAIYFIIGMVMGKILMALLGLSYAFTY